MADLIDCPADKREMLIEALADEVSEMSTREKAFLLLEAMDIREMLERAGEVCGDGREIH